MLGNGLYPTPRGKRRSAWPGRTWIQRSVGSCPMGRSNQTVPVIFESLRPHCCHVHPGPNVPPALEPERALILAHLYSHLGVADACGLQFQLCAVEPHHLQDFLACNWPFTRISMFSICFFLELKAKDKQKISNSSGCD